MAKGIKTRRGESKGAIKTYLYNEGDENTALTGGWTSLGVYGASAGFTFTKNATDMTTTMSTNATQGAHNILRTNNKINFADFTKLKVVISKPSETTNISRTRGSASLYTSSSQITSIDSTKVFILTNASAVEQVQSELELDITSINGSYYIYHEWNINALNVPLKTFKLHKMWLE